MDEFSHSAVLLVNGLAYRPYRYGSERELEERVLKVVDDVFGRECVYFDLKKVVRSRATRYVTDGVLLDPASRKLWIIEYELSRHDFDRHVRPQVMGFLRALKNPETVRDVLMTLYDEVRADPEKERRVRRHLRGGEELYYFLDRVLHGKWGVIIVVDEVTPQLMELQEDLSKDAEVRILEFKTYRHESGEAYLFTPLRYEREVAEVPGHERSWEARLMWAEPEARRLAEELIRRVVRELPDVRHMPKYRWYYFYRSERPFAVLLLRKRSVDVRIRVDEGRFKDELGVTKRYRPFFFRRGERGFKVKGSEELDSAVKLIKQAYNHAEV
ncbi:MAG: hypothetical protein ACTSXC_08260 [Candidatus Freyarchaeota archaeon]